MGGLKESNSNITFVNIKDGNLSVKQLNGDYKSYRSLGGIIKRVAFEVKTSQDGSKTYQTCKFILQNGEEAYQLELYTDSRYFLSLCNFLKSSNPLEEVEISPSEKPNDNGKKVQTFFVKQHDKSLKAAYTLNNMGDLPPLEPIPGTTYFDNSKQVEFWKNWLIATYGEFKINATPQQVQSVAQNQSADTIDPNSISEPLDDSELPF